MQADTQVTFASGSLGPAKSACTGFNTDFAFAGSLLLFLLLVNFLRVHVSSVGQALHFSFTRLFIYDYLSVFQ